MSTKRTSELTSLTGRRVLITRAAEQAPALAMPLRQLGAEPVVVPTIEIVAPASFNELDQAIADLGQTDYLVLTSVNAVNAFFDRLSALGHDSKVLGGVTTVAVGPKSAAAITARGVHADIVPEDFRAEGIVAALSGKVLGKRLLYPKAALARDLIATELTAAGAIVVDPVAYASAAPAETAEKLRQALATGLDLLTFTASSTVENFAKLLDSVDLARAQQVPVASIGPLTTATATRLGFKVAVEPDNATLDDMVESIVLYFEHL